MVVAKLKSLLAVIDPNAEVVNVATDTFEVTVKGHATFNSKTFDAALGVLGFDGTTANAYTVNLDYTLDVTIGKDASGFYLDGGASDKELQLDVQLPESNLSTVDATLGPFTVTATPTGAADLLDVKYAVDLQDGKYHSGDPLSTTSTIAGEADVTLGLAVC